MQIAIVGGGLAGLTCAKSLVDAGHQVRLYEALPFLGGRASTFRDASGDWIEQGLHLFLGTYSEFKKLLEEIGSPPDHALAWMNEIRIEDPDGPSAVYGTNPFTAPVKTILSLLGQNDFLGPVDKLSFAPISAQGLRSLESLREKYDQKTVAQLWQEWRGTEDVLERVLRPFCRAIQFTDVEEYSAFNFLGWLHHVAYDLPHSLAGAYKGARDELVFQPLARYLQRCGATIQTGRRLQEIGYAAEERRIRDFVIAPGERITADVYVAALPAWALAPILPAPLQADPFFATIAALPVAPAISVQIWFDRKVVESSDFTLVARSVMPVCQDQATITYPGGSRISVTISPADTYLSWSDPELVQLTVTELSRVHPETQAARITKSVVLKHPQHLIRPRPGAMSARPTQATPIANLFLAGDWTQQDYFGSQEGAVDNVRRPSSTRSPRPSASPRRVLRLKVCGVAVNRKSLPFRMGARAVWVKTHTTMARPCRKPTRPCCVRYRRARIALPSEAPQEGDEIGFLFLGQLRL